MIARPRLADTVAISWLGQAGFVIRGPAATVITDPYLSDEARERSGLDRVMAAPLTAEALLPDVVLVTHTHVDHFDVPTLRTYGAARGAHLVGSATTVAQASSQAGWPRAATTALLPGERTVVAGVDVTATFARHADADLVTGDSIGFLMRFEDLVIWHAGDTEYDARLRLAPAGMIDVALLPINGTGGNMNAHEAALLAWQLDVRVAIPMHFGMWADSGYTYGRADPWATLDPEAFVRTYSRLGGRGTAHVPEPGRLISLRRDTSGRLEIGGL